MQIQTQSPLDGIRDRFKPVLDSLIIEGTLLNNGIFHPLKAVHLDTTPLFI